MSGRLVPLYVERAGWEVWRAYVEFLDSDDLDRLRDAVTALGAALVRGDAITLAPDDVLANLPREATW